MSRRRQKARRTAEAERQRIEAQKAEKVSREAAEKTKAEEAAKAETKEIKVRSPRFPKRLMRPRSPAASAVTSARSTAAGMCPRKRPWRLQPIRGHAARHIVGNRRCAGCGARLGESYLSAGLSARLPCRWRTLRRDHVPQRPGSGRGRVVLAASSKGCCKACSLAPQSPSGGGAARAHRPAMGCCRRSRRLHAHSAWIPPVSVRRRKPSSLGSCRRP